MFDKPIILSDNQLKAWSNHEKRIAFLDTYETWEKIGAVSALGIIWYRYNLPDGGAILAMSYPTFNNSVRLVKYIHKRAGEIPFLGCWDGEGGVADVLKDLKARALKQRKEEVAGE